MCEDAVAVPNVVTTAAAASPRSKVSGESWIGGLGAARPCGVADGEIPPGRHQLQVIRDSWKGTLGTRSLPWACFEDLERPLEHVDT